MSAHGVIYGCTCGLLIRGKHALREHLKGRTHKVRIAGIVRACEWCGKSLASPVGAVSVHTWKRQRFCSKRCVMLYARTLLPENHDKRRLATDCVDCGAEVERRGKRLCRECHRTRNSIRKNRYKTATRGRRCVCGKDDSDPRVCFATLTYCTTCERRKIRNGVCPVDGCLRALYEGGIRCEEHGYVIPAPG